MSDYNIEYAGNCCSDKGRKLYLYLCKDQLSFPSGMTRRYRYWVCEECFKSHSKFVKVAYNILKARA